ncbi:18805_t:CDS:1, partial [Acaulospora morrowiae]
ISLTFGKFDKKIYTPHLREERLIFEWNKNGKYNGLFIGINNVTSK